MAKTAREYRRDLHQIPELDHDLPLTIEYVREQVSGLGGQLLEPAPNSLCVYFDAGRPDTMAFRADMDALPITEAAAGPQAEGFRSRHTGQMHACGHDGHMAMLLALCDYVAQNLGSLKYNVLAIFQPAEETDGGAEAICRSGILQEKNVRAVFGIHMWPGFAAGQLVGRRAELMARCSTVRIRIEGRSVHIAKSQQGADALEAAALYVTRTYELERSLKPGVLRLLKFGHLQAGTTGNVVAGNAQLEGTLRAFHDDTYDLLRQGAIDIAAEVAAQTGCTIDVDIAAGYPAVVNDGPLFDLVRSETGIDLIELDEPPMTGEDFSFYQKEVPGVFFFLGTGHDDALHTATFDLDELGLESGIELYRSLLDIDPAVLREATEAPL